MTRNGARSGQRTVWMVVLLGLFSIGGLIGMLVADAALDAVFFVFTALPLAVGLWRWKVAAPAGGRRTSTLEEDA